MDSELEQRLQRVEARLTHVETELQRSGTATSHASEVHATTSSIAPSTTTAPAPKEPNSATTSSTNSTELWLGKQGLSFAGILLLLPGMSFLLIYSIQYLGPWGRDLLGIGAAAVLFGLSRYLEPRAKGFSQFLFAGAAALLYFTVYAMHFFEVSRIITSQVFDITLLLGVAGATTWYTIQRYNSEDAAAVSYALVYATFFVGNLTAFSFIALLVATVTVVLLTIKKQWERLLLLGLILTYGTYLIWGAMIRSSAPFGVSQFTRMDALFLTIYFFIFSLPLLRSHEKSPAITGLTLFMNMAAYALLFGLAIEDKVSHGAAWLLIGIAIYHYYFGVIANTLKRPALMRTAVAIGSTALLGAIPLLFTDIGITWAWLFLGVAQLLLALFVPISSLRVTGFIGVGLASFMFFTTHLVFGEEVSRVTLGIALSIATLGTSGAYLALRGAAEHQLLRMFLYAVGLWAIAALAAAELTGTIITLAWGIAGVSALITGVLAHDRELRNLAFIAIGFMLMRVAFIDLAGTETLVRVISLIILGLILLGTSWMYHRYSTEDVDHRIDLR